MSIRSVSFSPGEYYHVYNRGVEKRTIFTQPSEYQRFVDLLYLTNGTKSVDMRSISQDFPDIFQWDRGEPLVAIGAYCLMPNHFHILLTPLVDGGVTKFMNKLGTSYSMFFNKKHDRSGSLFEGKFRASHADFDEYLKYLFAYIHLNPVKLIQSDWKEVGIQDYQKAFNYVGDYKYSSSGAYLNDKFDPMLTPEKFPPYFQSSKDWQEELFEWLKFPQNLPVPLH